MRHLHYIAFRIGLSTDDWTAASIMIWIRQWRRLWRCRLTDDAESENCAEHRGHVRAEPVCAGDRFVLRPVDADGAGGLTAMKMVKYTATV